MPRLPLFLALSPAFVACGSADFAKSDAGPDATIEDAATDAFSFGDVVNDGKPPPVALDGGGPFLCFGCVCDGTTSFCEFTSAGQAPVASDGGLGDAGACDLDGGSSCMAIPSQCLPNPTCKCVLESFSPVCTCALDPSDDGLVVSCVYP